MNYSSLLLSTDLGSMVDGADKLARTSSEVGVYNVIVGVFMIIVLLFVLMQMISFYKLTSKLNVIADASLKTLEYLSDKAQKEINLDQARAITNDALERSALSMKFNVVLMKELNHIDDTDLTRTKKPHK